ncbi:MAG: Hsp20/alpha crystallin family protein [Phycisphaeraceae bacterium]|nr:Hsp20/alpha crystallin family protein [Phycisphaerales bacterium]QOJ18960.1 MAG: Hsp20/alpha crystallin family protein [Phycisphaeraceae bacterium]
MTTTANAIQTSPCTAPARNGADSNSATWTYRPRVDIVDRPEEVVIFADLPGCTRESIQVGVERGVLTIDAAVPARTPKSSRWMRQEYGVGNFHRRFGLDDTIDASKASADYRNGVLAVRLPKTGAAVRRTIKVKG